MIVEETFESRSDRIRIRKLVSGMLQDNKRINAIFCADQTAADMLGDILQEEGYSKNNMKVVCFGMSREIYKYLHLDKLDCCVAIIKNAKSNRWGKRIS